MPACTQITLTPVTITSTGMTSTNTAGVYPLDTTSPAFTSVQSTANNAWSAVLGKNTIYYATSAPTGGTYTVGDTWFNTSAGNQMSTWNGSSWVVQQFSTAAFAGGSVDLSKLASGSVDASKLLSGAVTYGKIAAGAVGATEIAANSIVAGNIASSTITSSQIAAGTITGSNIAAGTIVAGNIATGTITATQISSGYVYAGTINASQINAGTLTGFTINNGSGTFQVSNTGVVTASSGTIGGFTLTSTSLLASGSALQLFSNSGGSGGYNIIAFNGIQGGSLDANGGAITGGTISTSGNGAISGTLQNSGAPTVTGTNNVILSASNVFQKNTASSCRFKRDIVDIVEIPELDPSLLLTIPVRAFRYNEGYLDAADSRVDTFVPGMIAEEVDAVYPIAVEYDGDLHDGPPLVWNEKYLLPGMLALIQQQAATITALESRIAALESRLPA